MSSLILVYAVAYFFLSVRFVLCVFYCYLLVDLVDLVDIRKDVDPGGGGEVGELWCCLVMMFVFSCVFWYPSLQLCFCFISVVGVFLLKRMFLFDLSCAICFL